MNIKTIVPTMFAVGDEDVRRRGAEIKKTIDGGRAGL
jgi:hypothetical protein